jgi:hypothetical protein
MEQTIKNKKIVLIPVRISTSFAACRSFIVLRSSVTSYVYATGVYHP